MYTDFYGLTAKPFQLTPDARFYFDSATHRKAMAYLGYGLAQGEGFIVITGEIGSGKTTLVGHLMDTIDDARLLAIKIVSTQIEGDDMLRVAAQGMGVSSEGLEKAQLLERIERFLAEQARVGKRVLLIVDEAQNLPVSALEELRMLSNFQAEGQALLQIFLLGQPEFRDKLAGAGRLEQLRQRVIATHHLEPMRPEEIEPYIVHRLRLSGWAGNPRFSPEACALMGEHSDGVPRRLNAIASRVLLHGAVERLELIDDRAVAAVITDLARESHVPAESLPPPLPVERRAPLRAVPSEPVKAIDDAMAARLALLEARVEEQEAALRRVLDLLVDWVEGEDERPAAAVLQGYA